MNVSSFPPVILRSWYPFDDQWKHFWIIYPIQYSIMNIGMIIVPCWHSFIVSIMVFVIIKLKLLNLELSEIVEVAKTGKHSGNVELVKCVNERQQMVDFVAELSSLISPALFFDFIIFSVLLCALLFQATQVNV